MYTGFDSVDIHIEQNPWWRLFSIAGRNVHHVSRV